MRPLVLAALLLAATPAFARFEPPLGADTPVAGEHTKVMTLGSAHLSAHSDEWKTGWLEPLIDRLVAWKPDIITVESLSGAQCEMMRADPATYGEVFDSYCRDAAPYQRSLGMTQAGAQAEADRLLADWPASPTPAQRRHLAMLFLAAGEPASAMVQWLRLPQAERKVADGLTEEAVEVLSRSNGRLNESYDVGSQVAARVGLERVYAVDDHTSDAVDISVDPGFAPWQIARFKAARENRRKNPDAQTVAAAAVKDGATLLAYYRAMNAPHAQDAQVASDFGGAIADPHPKRYGRQYAAWWDTRNLRMVANIRQATIAHPGARVLNIVGASHKPWYDQWMRQMGDVEVVPAHTVIGR